MLARESQGDNLRKRDDVDRLQYRVLTLKEDLTSAITKFNGHVEQYEDTHLMDDEEGPAGPDKINCANSVMRFVDRATYWYSRLENALDELKDIMSDTWEGNEEEFDAAIIKQNKEFQEYEEDYVNMTRNEIIEKCKSLIIRASRENQSIPEIEPAPKENRSNEAWADHEGEKLDNHSDHMAYDRKNHHPVVGLSSSEVLDAAKSHLLGQPCSTQLKEAKEKIKTLQARVHLYENGVNDKPDKHRLNQLGK